MEVQNFHSNFKDLRNNFMKNMIAWWLIYILSPLKKLFYDARSRKNKVGLDLPVDSTDYFVEVSAVKINEEIALTLSFSPQRGIREISPNSRRQNWKATWE